MCDTLADYASEPLNTLLSQLKADENHNPEEILLQNHHLLLQSPSLEQIYLDLGFSPTRHMFKSSLQKEQVIAALSGEPPVKDDIDDFHEDDLFLHRPLRYELTRTYAMESVDQLVELNEIGMANDFPDFPEDAESQHLSALWCPDRFSTPRTRAYVSENPTPRADRGLKLLSMRVKDLVSRHCETTYREVAEELISSLDEEEKRRKEEKNIKRRVYDALNVLGAAGVITKKGKKVSWVGQCPPPQACLTSCEETRERLDKKRQDLREKSNLVHIFKGLIDRNKKHPQSNRIAFPLTLIAAPSSPNNDISIRYKGGGTEVFASFERKFRVLDSETLLRHMRHIRQAPMNPDLLSALSPS